MPLSYRSFVHMNKSSFVPDDPKVIGILNPKGGAGKSTLATNIARALHLAGFATLLIDSDPQGTTRDWYASQAEEGWGPEVIAMDSKAIGRGLGRITQGFEYVLIDGAAKIDGRESADVVKACDVILIPVQPSPADIWGAADLIEIIQARRSVTNGRPKAAIVISRQVVGTKLAESVSDALAAYELPILQARTSQRVGYAEALMEGKGVVDAEPDGKAAEEIKAIMKELLELING